MKNRIVLLLALVGALAAQNWSVRLIPAPSTQFFIEQLWSCAITNTEEEPVDVRLYGWITHEGTEIAHARSNVITIPPGGKRIASADIRSIQDEWYDPAYEEVVARRGALPAGVYTYCIRVEDESGAVLAEDCREHRGITPSPPKLLAPPNGSNITEPQPTFVWTPPVPPTEGVTYRLRIVEIPEEMTPDEAISAAEPWFEEKGITNTSLQYPMDARPLEEDSEYAWQVTAWVGEFLVGASQTWLFGLKVEIPRLDSCQCYYDKETDVMWHGIGHGGRMGVRKDSCTYVVTVDGVMYHTDGKTWTTVEMKKEDKCKLFVAKNGLFHFNGQKWEAQQNYYKCNYVLAENGMFHFNGTSWVQVKDSTCTYVHTVASTGQGRTRIMYHFNGQKWEQVAGRKCQLFVAINGLYHFDGTRWVAQRFRRCNAVLAENGMFHFNGTTWVQVKDSTCTYVHTVASTGHGTKPIMYHYNGEKWEQVAVEECQIYAAVNGMFHFTGRGWSQIKPKKCNAVLAENGMFHFNGTTWVQVKDSTCTYVYTVASTDMGETPIMYHYDGRRWRRIRAERCQLFRAVNGMFHFTGRGWNQIKFKKCNYVLAENGMFHYNGEIWDKVKDSTCTHVYTVGSTRKGKQPIVYHYDGKEWKEVPRIRGTTIEAVNGVYHYDGRRWKRIE
ncbi:hypothetical protein CEE36_06430 [candidate division TA06 bacterium B3_TA06]|uniref:Fibronectin type-III domain-containing protein n=1 Tax=candidate division TA06 bacterium B3_TA06 TaxID=2012487 RepID=A0A532V6S9_UNCT6|nr:MAG: hypothetical protein CEE36_06430 [candidate division TA06 bacterium B3_TA06]